MKHGFSLVELSIVLVILGLLTGGILGGQALMHAASLRSVMTDIERYQTATHTFKDKYFALPGDMSNASSFWPTLCTDDLANDNTCNGNANGIIERIVANDLDERLRIWQHLSLAGLIEGNYTGVNSAIASGGGFFVAAGENVPSLEFNNGQVAFFSTSRANQCGAGDQWTTAAALQTRTSFHLGAAGGWGWSNLFAPEDAWALDAKMDDGNPASGRVYPLCAIPQCTTATTESAEYSLSSSAIACLMTVDAF